MHFIVNQDLVVSLREPTCQKIDIDVDVHSFAFCHAFAAFPFA